MLAVRDNLAQCLSAMRAHKLRAILTIVGLTMGVATLITVMTIVQGANLYVEQKVANLGTNVFQIAKGPFTLLDFAAVIKALRNRNIKLEDMEAVAAACQHCQLVGASASNTLTVRYKDRELQDVSLNGQTPNMVDIDTKTLERGRFFNESEDRHSAQVCVIGDKLVSEFFPGADPVGRTIRAGSMEFTIVGTYEKIGSVLGQ